MLCREPTRQPTSKPTRPSSAPRYFCRYLSPPSLALFSHVLYYTIANNPNPLVATLHICLPYLITPSGQPSKQPINHPSSQPSKQPTQQPTGEPTNQPTSQVCDMHTSQSPSFLMIHKYIPTDRILHCSALCTSSMHGSNQSLSLLPKAIKTTHTTTDWRTYESTNVTTFERTDKSTDIAAYQTTYTTTHTATYTTTNITTVPSPNHASNGTTIATSH